MWCVYVTLAFVGIISTVINRVVDQLESDAGAFVCACVLHSAVAMARRVVSVSRNTIHYETVTHKS